MKLWIIRHGIAEDRSVFEGDDLDRPLTEKGIQRSRTVFTGLAKRCEAPELVVSSLAVRACQTAKIFCDVYGMDTFRKSKALNPGASVSSLQHLVDSLGKDLESAALIGHEPDLSLAVSQWTSQGSLNMILKKAGIVQLAYEPGGYAELLMLIPPKFLA